MVAAMINASTVALINAAVPMRGVVCAVSMGYSNITKGLVLDPGEEDKLNASGCFAFMFASTDDEAEVWSNWQSKAGFDERELSEAKNLARAGARDVWLKIKEVLGPKQVDEDSEDEDDDKMEI